MSLLRQQFEGLQKIEERRRKMGEVIRLTHSYFEQVCSIPVLPNEHGKMLALEIGDEPFSTDEEYQRSGLHMESLSNEGAKEYALSVEVFVSASGLVAIKPQIFGNDYGYSDPSVINFDMDSYSVPEVFAKIITALEEINIYLLGPHLRHAQKAIIANTPHPDKGFGPILD